MRFPLLRVLLVAGLCLVAGAAAATTRVVALDGSGDYTAIQPAIDASSHYDTVLVKDGTYTGPLNRGLDFGGTELVLKSMNGPAGCIIDCEGQARGVRFYQNQGSTSIVQGFTITHGAADDGAGVMIWGGDATGAAQVIGCVFNDCDASSEGGAIYVSSGYTPRIHDNSFFYNGAQYGGAIWTNTSLDLANNLFIQNGAWYQGGALYAKMATTSISIDHCNFIGNDCGVGAGGQGGAFYACLQSVYHIKNSIFWGNNADEGPTGYGTQDGYYSTIIYVDYSCVENGSASVGGPGMLFYGGDNITDDPRFISGPGGAYYLRLAALGQYPESPCIDAGEGRPSQHDVYDGWLIHRTTRTDEVPDGSPVDIGYHYTSDAAVTVYVPEDRTAIQGGIDLARDGDAVSVAYGIYEEAIDLSGKAITVEARLAGEPKPIIWADGLGAPAVSFQSGEGDDTVLDGFEIALGTGINGGGIYCHAASPRILDCRVHSNTASSTGGGLYCSGGAEPVVDGCTFRGNTAGLYGGGICIGTANPTITGCLIYQNEAPGGGGIAGLGDPDGTIFDNILYDNTANRGGGIYVTAGALTFSDCTLYGNEGVLSGGGAFVSNNGTLNLDGCIVAHSPQGEGVDCDTGGVATLSCCDVFGNDGGDYVGIIAAAYGTAGNIHSDPLCCDPPGLDFRLAANSLCLAANHPDGCAIGAEGQGCGAVYTTHLVLDDGTGFFGTIQEAIDGAALGDTIELADGTFSGDGNRDLDTRGKPLVLRSQGGLALNCRLEVGGSAGDPHRGFYIHGGESDDTVIRNLTVASGHAYGGGGLYAAGSSPTLDGVVFLMNVAEDDGGGALFTSGCDPLIVACTFRENHAGDNGGGLYFDGSCTPSISGCLFDTNSATDAGAGLGYVSSGGTAQDCAFIENAAGIGGSGLFTHGYCAPDVSRCTFHGNTGTAVLVRHYSTVDFANTIISGTTSGPAAECTSGSTLDLACCDVWGNAGGDYTGCIAGEAGSDGNFCADPLFCDAAAGDFTLRNDSPCAEGNCSCGQVGAYGLGGCGPNRYVVKPDGSGDFPTLRDAIAACADGDSIMLTDGVFTGPDNRELDYGGLAIRIYSESGDPAACVIDCENAGWGFLFDSGEGGGSVLAGVTVTNATRIFGSAVRVVDAAPVIDNCRFVDNTASSSAGAVYTSGAAASPVFLGCVFEDNTAPNGGAYWAYRSDNTLTDCVFRNNSATYNGGALTLDNYTSATVTGCTFVGNSCGYAGGATAILAYSYAAITGCTYHANASGTYYPGSAIYCSLESSPDLANTIIAFGVNGNAVEAASSSFPSLACCDIHGNTGGDWTGVIADQLGDDGNIDEDPRFCDPDGGDLTLQATSPCAAENNPGCGQIGAWGVGCGPFVYLVKPDGTGDYPTLRAAIAGCADGDTILVADGTFTGPDNRALDYGGRAIVIRSQNGDPAACLIDCESAGRAFSFQSGEDSTSVLAGVTLVNGNAWDGGAVACTAGSSPMFTNCVFLDNVSTDDAGALYCFTAAPVVDHCRFLGNSCADDGGAMLCRDGAAPDIRGCVFYDNVAGDLGGAIHCQDFATPNIISTTFAANEAGSGQGGGLYCHNQSRAIVTGCIIAFSVGSDAVHCGGAEPYPVLAACDLWGNDGGDWVGCIADQYGVLWNFSLDPRFCDLAAGDLTLAGNSPCLPENNDIGSLIGALGQGCEAGPEIALLPGALDLTVAPGGAAGAELLVGNAGGGDLVWFATEEAGALGRHEGSVAAPLAAPAVRPGARPAAELPAPRPVLAAVRQPILQAASGLRGGPEPLGEPVARGAGGPDGFGHVWIDADDPGGPAFAWIDITAVGTEIVLSLDDSETIPLPFAFPFYGVMHDSITVGSHGYLTFGEVGDAHVNDPIPDSGHPNDIIAVFWDDVSTYNGDGTVHVHHDADGNRFIVQYTALQPYGGGLPVTFEAILHPDGSILCQYLDMQGTLTSATIGIENDDGSDGLQVVYNAAYVHDGLAVLIARDAVPWLSVSPVGGSVTGGESQAVQVLVDAAGLAPGDYAASLLVHSNDPDAPALTLPVSVTVKTTFQVDPGGAGDFTTLQDALDAAAAGTVIELADGTYTGDGNRDLDFHGHDVIIRSGGRNADACVIDCEGAAGDYHRAFVFDEGEGPGTVIEGITIRGGYHLNGGGVWMTDASPIFRDCVIEDNRARTPDSGGTGGGVYALRGAPRFERCVFRGNASDLSGGGARVTQSGAVFDSCLVEQNSTGAEMGGAGGGIIASGATTIRGCTIQGNVCNLGQGGGLYVDTQCAVVVCRILENEAEAGGGVFAHGDSVPTAVLDSCVVARNQASYGGGLAGMARSAAVRRSTFAANEAPYGSGMHFATDDYGRPIEDCIIAHGLGGQAVACDEGGATISLSCCDVVGNAGGDYVGCLASQAGASGNFTLEPLFCDLAGGDYGLTDVSPCLPGNNDCGVLVGALGEGCTYPVAVDDAPAAPARLVLQQNAPNPFNPSTTIRFGLPQDAPVTLRIHDVSGRLVASLLEGERLPAGWHAVTWRGRDDGGRAAASGVYFCRLVAAGEAGTRKMLLIK
ncbi:MAG: right-handed parallel beta-helix repeat-containing protein [Candidatus Krumholzibacteriota bacterium]|nr:right-handed parallel beta-helix repeat-containing protein [Candidatus Krumholzibacteriota bacterium]